MIHGIHHVAVHVRDIDRMTRFYCDAFGFKPTGFTFAWRDDPVTDEVIGVSNSAGESVMLCAGNCYLELFQYSAPAPASTAALNPQDRGYTHFCVDVTEIDAEIERLRKLGMTFDRPYGKANAVDCVIVKVIYGRDPEGNVIEIQETRDQCPMPASALPRADFTSSNCEMRRGAGA